MFETLKLSTLLLTLYFTVTTIAVIIIHELFGNEIKRPWTILAVCLVWPIALMIFVFYTIYRIVNWTIKKFFKK